ncbi:MAG: TraR/DksA family transcriptional regulator [Brevinematales bacterium]|nr:TraR/DksA family transcriptional regulator [Brevinematales bacterium]
MDQKKIAHFKERLLEMEKEILENIQSESYEDENPFDVDGDLIDKADVLSSASLTEGLSASQKKMLEEIRRALQRIKDGTYGVCQVCGSEIEEERLEAIPYADKCKKHMGR